MQRQLFPQILSQYHQTPNEAGNFTLRLATVAGLSATLNMFWSGFKLWREPCLKIDRLAMATLEQQYLTGCFKVRTAVELSEAVRTGAIKCHGCDNSLYL